MQYEKKYNLKPNPHMQKTHVNKPCIYILQHNEENEKFVPLRSLFIYVWTAFEHQVQDLYASRGVQVSSSLPGRILFLSKHKTLNEHVQ